ncbi:sodium:solute symporter family protein [Sulfitobacter sp. HNIBRBA3233]|uniref:sodium:solute symporter family protein n=1 Tax=Sulfitobacter marinivivus TaxID=3158558 RepID=UPI0032DF8C74
MIAPGLIWVVIAVFAAFGFIIAVRAARANSGTASDYYIGGRDIGGMVAGLSYAATTYSAFMLVVLTGLTYRGGIGALGFELIYFAGLSLLVIFAPRFWLVGKRWGFISPAEMIGARYGSRGLARAMAIVSIVFLLPYCTTQMAGIGLLLSGVTGGEISLFQAVATGAALAMFWALLAGLRSVAWTDAAMSVVMLVSGLLAVAFAVAALGGPAEFLGTLQADHAEWLTVPGPGLWSLPTFIALSLPWFFFTLSNPQVSQRLFILRDFQAMRRMILWVLGFGFVFTLVAVIWGLAALQLAPDIANTSMATPALLSSGVIPTWVVLLLIIGILSAAISTLDSIALTVGAMIARDVVPRVEAQNDARQILSGRLVIVAVVLFASYFALEKAAIVDQLAALSAAGLMVSVPPIVGAFFWRSGTATGAMAAIVGGAAVAVWLAIFQGVSVFNPVLPFAVGGTSVLLFIAVSIFTKPRANALDFQSEITDQLTYHRAW